MTTPSGTRARIWWERNTWLVPLLGVIGGYLAADFALLLDEAEFLAAGAQQQISASAATAILAAVGGGMVTFAGFVFSFVLLIVQFGSSAYSPRMVAQLLQSRVTQVVLATFLATITFSLISLIGVGALGDTYVPALSVSLSVALLAISLVGFIVLLHTVGTRIRVDRVIARFGRRANWFLLRLPPPDDGAAVPEPDGQGQVVAHRGRSGQVAAIERGRLVRLAARHACTIDMIVRVGDAVRPGTPLARVSGAPASEVDVSRTLVVSAERSLRYDPWYAVRILVDIALRALSPAVNDPTTAVRALDEIEDVLHLAATRPLGASVLTRGGGTVVLRGIEWSELVDLALLEIVTSSRDQPQVNRRLVALVHDLVQDLPPGRGAALQEYLPDIRRVPGSLPGRAQEQWAAGDRQGLGGSA